MCSLLSARHNPLLVLPITHNPSPITTLHPSHFSSLSKNNIGDDFGTDMFVESVDQSLAAEGEFAAESGRGEMHIEFAVADM